MKDYSQSGEQPAILAWAERHGRGRWLDLGAADGETASNTRALALAGWPGVAVEAAAIQFDRLTALYSDRPDVECVQAAVLVDEEPLIRFHYSHDLVSTTERANMETWASVADFHPCHVAAVTLEQLLDVLAGPYDLVNVDTEGTSVELWRELRRLDAFAPGALACVEAEDGGERWLIQQACTEGWARVLVTENNVLLERLR